MQEIFVNRKVRPIHPGEIISDILQDLKISQTKFAEIIGVSHRSVNEIIQGKRPITVDTAIRIGKALGNGSQLWLNLQQKVDIWDALQAHGEDYERVVTLVA